MGWLREKTFAIAGDVLTKEHRGYQRVYGDDLSSLRRTLQKGDVVLVEGNQRISEVIKFLTQSSWSHSAIYVGDELLRRHPEQRAALWQRFGEEAEYLLVEATMEEGVVASPLSKYADLNVRVCRPFGLHHEHLRRIFDEIIAQLGNKYDVEHVLALARYFFPVSLIPRRMRRRALEMGTRLTTDVICSKLIGRAFQNVGYPILPLIDLPNAPAPRRRLAERMFARRQPYRSVFRALSPDLITPRDFDLSPYFEIVKINSVDAEAFDYRRIQWAPSEFIAQQVPVLTNDNGHGPLKAHGVLNGNGLVTYANGHGHGAAHGNGNGNANGNGHANGTGHANGNGAAAPIAGARPPSSRADAR